MFVWLAVVNFKVVAAPLSKYRSIIGYSILGCLFLYVLLGLVLISFPKLVLINHKATRYCRWIVLPGPYFREDRIQSMGNFQVSGKIRGGDWSAWRNMEREHFMRYHDGFFDYGTLRRSRLERFMAQSLKQAVMAEPGRDVHGLAAFQKLHNYMRRRYLPADVDSVRLMYVQKQGTGMQDTLVYIVYKSF